MPIKKFTFLIVFFFIIVLNVKAQDVVNDNRLTLKKLSEKISSAEDADDIKLHLNAKQRGQYSSSFLNVNKYSGLSEKNDISLADTKYSSLTNITKIPIGKNEKAKNFFPEEYIPWESNRHFGLAAGEELLFNIFIPWALARYGRTWDSTSEERWPFIGFNSIWSNLNEGWNYDGDNFLTNMFSHPYGGNLFFNSGRSNGYNFWESTAFALAGSYLWETFMETNQPAINDWVNTGLNGAAFGEVLYRLSTLITDNQARGGHRVWTEAMGALVNPVRFFTRLVTGEVSRVFRNPSWRKPDKLKISLKAGTRVLFEEDSTHNDNNKELEGIFELTIHYGSAYRLKHATPFSHFYYNIAIASSSPNLTSMNVVGSLFAFQLSDKKTSKHSLETTLNYNYLNNPGFLYGNAAIVEQLNSLFKVKDGLDLRTKVGVRIIPMGGTPNDYFYDSVDGRGYDFGQGLGLIGRVSLHSSDWDIFTIQYDMDYIWTESLPAESKHFLQGGELNFQLPIRDYFVFGVAAGYYKRKSYYDYAPDVSFQTPIVRVFFKTRIL